MELAPGSNLFIRRFSLFPYLVEVWFIGITEVAMVLIAADIRLTLLSTLNTREIFCA